MLSLLYSFIFKKETQLVEILVMIDYGDITRIQMEVCSLFNGKYLEPIS